MRQMCWRHTPKLLSAPPADLKKLEKVVDAMKKKVEAQRGLVKKLGDKMRAEKRKEEAAAAKKSAKKP